MNNLAQRFLTQQELERVTSAVAAAEKRTSGEIVCMVESASYTYPMANVIGATVISLPLALLLTPVVGGLLWIGTQNLWLFIGLFGLLFILFYFIVDRTPALKRRFIGNKEIEEEVEEAAITSFFRHGLYRTRDANGILIFISVFERKVWVLADHGVNAKVPEGQWDEIVQQITEGIRQKQAAEALKNAVTRVGDILQNHFPIKSDDTDELKNVIIGNAD